MSRARAGWWIAAAAVAAAASAAVANGSDGLPGGIRTETSATRSACPAVKPHGAYGWPVRPFDAQHPVRGNFGDPRIINGGGLLAESASITGSYDFHNGVDIAAPDGSPVYPVENGSVRYVALDYIVVVSGNRTFHYWHIRPTVARGQHVIARRTVLGTIIRGQGHVHLTEIDGTHVVNPLAPGHLFPYRDSIPPVVDAVSFVGSGGRELQRTQVRGIVEVVAQAHDESSLPVPGAWANMPVSPATISWTLLREDGQTIASGTGVDFRYTVPPRHRFWSTYAHGTYQNFPVVANRYLSGTAGRYLYRLTRLDTRTLPPGYYRLRVDASDVCGNVGTLTSGFDISDS
jgi:hypothetical protein